MPKIEECARQRFMLLIRSGEAGLTTCKIGWWKNMWDWWKNMWERRSQQCCFMRAMPRNIGSMSNGERNVLCLSSQNVQAPRANLEEEWLFGGWWWSEDGAL